MLYSCNTGHQVIVVCWCMIGSFQILPFFMIFVLMLQLSRCLHCLYSKDFIMDSILDQLLNCYFNRTYRSSSYNKQITQAEKEQGCLEEVFIILPVLVLCPYCMPPETHSMKYVKNYILGIKYVTDMPIYFRQNTP